MGFMFMFSVDDAVRGGNRTEIKKCKNGKAADTV